MVNMISEQWGYHMKKTFFLIGFLLLSTFLMANFTLAEDYSLGAQEELELQQEIRLLDEDGLDALLGDDWEDIVTLYSGGDGDIEQGSKSKLVVKKVEDKKDYWKVTYDVWHFTTKPFEDKADDKDEEVEIQKDPEDQNTIPQFCPVPVNEYLENIDYYSSDMSVEENIVKFERKANGNKFFINYEFDASNGLINTITLTDEDDREYMVIETPLAVPGYQVPSILGIMALSIIGLIYSISKRRK